jgi:tetratricopeptide (TPR) repeat protein/tRNA A-37 threonylcarbamoyl transferase component Bud32
MAQVDDQPGKTLPLGGATTDGDRFHILRPWREGGLGKVSIAEDEQLHREVALKEIKIDHARDKRSCDRFLLEAEITGALEHPGIVPVYALGQYSDGRPFYAMRFVRGDTLEEAIERFHRADSAKARDRGQRSVAFRKLLARFIDVCNAVAYAHSRGVLHRDLKPSNVLLGKYGETLVVDWGLAKVLGKEDGDVLAEETPFVLQSEHDSAPTRMGTLIGSPRFMSPEQAAGRLDLLSPASDVYSLGATLYVLLTGVAPFRDPDLQTVLHKVQQGDFPLPRQASEKIAPALEAVCLKAMAIKPSDRYASPREMADDIEHWLADQPVAAYREPLLARFNRWGRHHRALVTGGIALLCTAFVALSVSTALLGRAQLETDWQREEAVAAKKVAVQNRLLAEQRAKESADRFELALDILQRLVFEVQDRLEQMPGTADLRTDLLNAAQQGLKRLVDASHQDNAIQADSTMVWAHLRLGQLYLFAGKTTEATEQYQRGFEAAQKAVNDSPHDADAQVDLAAAYEKLGELIQHLGNLAEAHNFYEHALQICETITAADARNADAAELLPKLYDHLAEVALQLGDSSQASAYRRKRERLPDVTGTKP